MIFEGTKKSIFFGLGLTRAGLSVPDSDMLISMSKILETPVSTLLAPFFYLPGFRCLICAAAF